MRKVIPFLLAAGLLCATAQPVSAVEIKPFGSAEFAFQAMGNLGIFEPGNGFALQDSGDVLHNYGQQYHPKHSRVVQRFIIGVDMTASESLSAHYDAIAGFSTWGGPATGLTGAVQQGGALGSRAANIVTRQAYLEWVIPSTSIKIRMGNQFILSPVYAVGTASFFSNDDTATALLMTAPINDTFTLTGGWIRGASEPRRGATVKDIYTDDNLDIFMLCLPIKLEGMAFTPWGNWGLYGNNVGDAPYYSYVGASFLDPGAVNNWLPLYQAAKTAATRQGLPNWVGERGNSKIWLVGLGGELTKFDPFRFAFDFEYAAIDTKYRFLDRAGWMFGASAEYKTGNGTPTLKAWYASGDDGNIDNGAERSPSTGGFARSGASYFFGGNAAGNVMTTANNSQAGGSWGVSLQWNHVSFLEGMWHNFHITYAQGTNSKRMAGYADPRFVQNYLTTNDSIVELDFETSYSIYTNLAAVIDMAYIIQNIDGKLWAKNADGGLRRAGVDKLHFSNAWSVGMNLRYFF